MPRRSTKPSFSTVRSSAHRDAIIHSSYVPEAALRRIVRNFDVVSISKPAINLARLAVVKIIKQLVEDILQNVEDTGSEMVARPHCMFSAKNNLRGRATISEPVSSTFCKI